MKSDRLRILMLADSRAVHTERLVAELRRQNCRVLIASVERGRMHHLKLKARGRIHALHYVLAVPQLKKLIKRYRPDVINAHFASGYGFMAALADRKHRLPLFLNLWGSDVLIVPHKTFLHRRKTALALDRADFISADSEYLLRAADKLVTIEKTRIIPWGIEERFLRLHKQDYHLGKPLRILVPRHHERIYNNLFIIRSLTPLVNEGRVEITFPSFGSLADSFRQNAATLVGDRIKYYAKLPRADFMRFMSEHDVYLSGALSDSSPVSLIESMGLGLIPIAADIPGVREWMTPNRGYLYQAYNAGELRRLVRELVDKDDPHDEMRRSNLDRVRSEARFEQNVADTIEIMRSLAGRKLK